MTICIKKKKNPLIGSISRSEQGMTLIELLIAMAIFTVVVALIVTAKNRQQNQQMSQQQAVEMQQTNRATLMMMTREIRMAGFDPDNDINNEGITAVGDVDTSDSVNNLIAFSYAESGSAENLSYGLEDNDADGDLDLVKEVNGGGYQLLAENVQNINITYLDEDGNTITIPSPTNNQSTLDEIRALQINITLAVDNKELNRLDTDNTRSLTTTVKCRNLGL